MVEGGPPIEETRAYFRGMHSALAALERRLEARPGLSGDDALKEIRRYRMMAHENQSALEHVAKLQGG